MVLQSHFSILKCFRHLILSQLCHSSSAKFRAKIWWYIWICKHVLENGVHFWIWVFRIHIFHLALNFGLSNPHHAFDGKFTLVFHLGLPFSDTFDFLSNPCPSFSVKFGQHIGLSKSLFNYLIHLILLPLRPSSSAKFRPEFDFIFESISKMP